MLLRKPKSKMELHCISWSTDQLSTVPQSCTGTSVQNPCHYWICEFNLSMSKSERLESSVSSIRNQIKTITICPVISSETQCTKCIIKINIRPSNKSHSLKIRNTLHDPIKLSILYSFGIENDVTHCYCYTIVKVNRDKTFPQSCSSKFH